MQFLYVISRRSNNLFISAFPGPFISGMLYTSISNAFETRRIMFYRCFCTTQEVIHPQSSIMIYNISFYRCILIFLQVVHFSIVCTINISSCFNSNCFQTKISVAKDGFKNYSLFRDKITEALVTFFN